MSEQAIRKRVTAKVARDILKSRFDPNAAFVRQLGEGETTQAFSFVLGAQTYVARFSDTDFGFRKDKYVDETFGGRSLPTCKTIAIGKHTEDLAYSIVEMAPGRKIAEFRDEFYTSPLLNDLVDIVVHNRTKPVPGEHYGRWDVDGKANQPSWKSFLLEIVNDRERLNTQLQGIVGQSRLELALALYDRLMVSCPDIRGLVHGDFSLSNVFSDGRKITCIIDWGNALFGDPVYDIAWISFWDTRADYDKIYRNRISLLGIDESNLDERILCYKLHCALTCLIWYSRSGQSRGASATYALKQLSSLVGGGQEGPSGNFYQDLDRPHFVYDLQKVAGLVGELHRGPAVDREKPYIACLGAAQTFGRFSHWPFPFLLSQGLQHQVLNLGVGGAGPRLFDSEGYLDIVNKAEVAIVQVLAARSEGNSLFDNSKSGSLKGIRLSDGKEMRFETFLDSLMESEAVPVVQQAVGETRENYVRNLIHLLERIKVPKILLWLSTRGPDVEDDYSSAMRLLGPFPQLVNRPMIEELKLHCDAYVECVSSQGIPQALWSGTEKIDGTLIEGGMLVNYYYPSPEMHVEAAKRLLPECMKLLKPGSSRAPSQASPSPEAQDCQPFVLICAERTGSNLLLGLLNSHRDLFAGGELFNPVLADKGVVDWALCPKEQLAAMADLRRSDPRAFLQALFAMATKQGHHHVGFKLMYSHAELLKSMQHLLFADQSLRVIHLKRRNRLRRYLSVQRAKATGQWATAYNAPPQQLPKIEIDFESCIFDFLRMEKREADYQALFQDHDVIEVFYEDLEEDPIAVGTTVLSFLGLKEMPEFAVRFTKSGIDPLSDAIVNYEELKAHFDRWARFFSN